MPQPRLEFLGFGDAAQYFYKKFSESAPLRFDRYFQDSGGREIEAVAKYRWNLELSAALIPCLEASELALRNAIHQAMCKAYLPAHEGTFPNGQPADEEWWFDAKVRGRDLLQERDWRKVTEAYDKIPKNGEPITPRVVAELSFGFWVELLNSNYDETIVVPMLGTTMKNVQKAYTPNRTHGWLRERFGEIRDLRNRVSHHERVYHLEKLEFIWRMAWLLSAEIYPFYTNTVRLSCKFEPVLRDRWTLQERTIREAVNTQLYEIYKKRPSPEAPGSSADTGSL